jgi:hypothetical protein
MDMVNDNAFDYMDLFDKDMYTTISTSNCPDEPPIGYRFAWKLLKIIIHWPANDPEPRTQIFQSLCVFNYVKDYKKAKCYRGAEVPFVVKGDPKVAKTVKRWNTPHYVDALLGHVVKHDIDYTVTNHFLYWMKEGENPVTGSSLLSKCTHWYFRVSGYREGKRCAPITSVYVFDELPFYQPKHASLYVKETSW